LVDQLVAYEHSSDHRYYTTRFVDRLKDDIKSVVLVQQPVDLDIAYTLALLQEEAAMICHRETSRPNAAFRPKPHNTATPLPLPPPPNWDKSLGGKGSKAKHNTNTTRFSPVDSKVVALRAYHRAKGLCQYCAEKYFRCHTGICFRLKGKVLRLLII
jgi:hypothetical protein